LVMVPAFKKGHNSNLAKKGHSKEKTYFKASRAVQYVLQEMTSRSIFVQFLDNMWTKCLAHLDC